MLASPPCAALDPPGGGGDALIELLHALQQQQGYLSAAALRQVAQLLRLPLSRVYGVASFYHLFRLQPPTAHRLGICLGSACFVRGAMGLAQQLAERLGVALGDPAGDGLWSLMPLGCLGACGQAPVLLVDEALLTRLPMAAAAATELQQRLQAAGLPQCPLTERPPALASPFDRPGDASPHSLRDERPGAASSPAHQLRAESTAAPKQP